MSDLRKLIHLLTPKRVGDDIEQTSSLDTSMHA